MRATCVSSIFLALASLTHAADPIPKSDAPLGAVTLTPGKPASATVGKKCVLTIDTTAKKVTWKVPPGVDTLQIDGKRLAVWADTGVYTLLAQVPSGDDVLSTEIILTVVGPRPPPPGPNPPGPGPQPPPGPTPVAKSFHVIWVIESGVTQPAGVLAVADGKACWDYLNEKTNAEGQWAGWRRYDPQAPTTDETPFFKALWADVQPKILGKKLCVVVEVDGKVTIEDYPATPAAAIALFKKLNGGR